MVNLNFCPVCKNSVFEPYLIVKDHFLSKEDFNIVICKKCGFKFTNPRPDEDNLINYYLSDDYISHGRSRSLIIENIYKIIRKYSFYKKHQLIVNQCVGKNILDVGCGTGEFLAYFQQKGWQTFGIEPSVSPREYAKSKLKLDVKDETGLNDFSSGYFDVITMWHVLEHVWNIDYKIHQLLKILKNDGLLVFALPNADSWDCKRYHSHWAAWDVPRHLSHFTTSTFQKFMNNYNLDIISTIPMKFDSFYVSLLSEKYLGNKWIFPRALLNGFLSNHHATKNNNSFSSMIYLVKNKNS